MTELEPEDRQTLLRRGAGLLLLYLTTAVMMGAGLYALIQVFDGSFQDLQVPGGSAERVKPQQAPR